MKSGPDDDEPWTQHMRRKEQDSVDRIIHGHERGHYFMLLGPKVRRSIILIFFWEVECVSIPGYRQDHHDFGCDASKQSRRSALDLRIF